MSESPDERERFQKWREQFDLFCADYASYVDGDLKMPFSTLRDSLAAFVEECHNLDAARAQLAEPQEPVATVGGLVLSDMPNDKTWGRQFWVEAAKVNGLERGQKLYATPARVSAQTEPPGWKLVPLEPTNEMLMADALPEDMQYTLGPVTDVPPSLCRTIYRAMLAAAPAQVPAPAQQEPSSAADALVYQLPASPARIRSALNLLEAMEKQDHPEPAPAPAEQELRPGIEAAAKLLDKKREEFDREFGNVDPDTGTLEFGRGDHARAKEEYSYTLAELADDIRAIAKDSARTGSEG